MSRGHPVTRIARLLALVPYFQAHPGILKEDAARDLGISVSQLDKDLQLLWLCGVPGHAGGDLIDVEFTGPTVEVFQSQGMDRPLRLTPAEASTILLALGFLVDQRSSIDPSAAQSAMAKIEQAAGSGPGHGAGGRSDDDGPARWGPDDAVADTVAAAAHRHRALRIRYYSASRDALADRIVDPVRIQIVGAHNYLEAWCRQAEGTRMFRFDRIDEARILDEPSAPPDAPAVEAMADFTDADTELPHVRLLIAPDSLWALDYFPMERTAQRDDGTVEVTLRYASDAWLTRILTGFGGRLRVLDDPDLIERVQHSACAALDAYASVADQAPSESGGMQPGDGALPHEPRVR